MLLSGAGDQKFLGLRIAEEAQHGVFFHQLVEADAQLVFVGAALRLDGEGDGRLGQLDARILDRGCLVAQRVAGERVFQLRDRANIAGVQLRDRNGGFALHDGDVGELLLRVAVEVLQRGVVLQHAGKNFEIGNAAGEGVGHGLENVERCGLGVGTLARREARHCRRRSP